MFYYKCNINFKLSNFINSLTSWYKVNSRDLPWRSTKDPYIIWISEIILQQTRVNQGLPYFYKFVNKFDTISTLADAEEVEVLKIWQGLGYYSRARNMHKCAKIISQDLNGIFPDSYIELIKLPGIGSYTAAAIASFAFNQPVAVVDGNVQRVISRYLGVEAPVNEKKGASLIKEFVDNEIISADPYLFNQGIMELGAMICKPVQPTCSDCPISSGCFALENGKIEELPIKIKKLKVTKKFFNYFLMERDGRVKLLKRTSEAIWKHLYEFPMIETPNSQVYKDCLLVGNLTHNLTHQKIDAKLWKVNKLPSQLSQNKRIFEVPIESLGSDYPIHQLMIKMNKLWRDQ